jgi:hypothetical protein
VWQTALHQYLNCCRHLVEAEPQKMMTLVADSAVGSEPALVTDLLPGLEMGLQLATGMETGLALDLV